MQFKKIIILIVAAQLYWSDVPAQNPIKKNMVELDGPVTVIKPEHYIEGPCTYKGIIRENVVNSFTTHPGITEYKGSSYFLYHNGSLPAGGSYRRSVCLDYMYYNEDGTIQKIKRTAAGVRPVK